MNYEKKWTMEDLQGELRSRQAHGGLRFYAGSSSRSERLEQYLLRGKKEKTVEADQIRKVLQNETRIQIWIEGGAGKLGTASGKISSQNSLNDELDNLVSQAKLGEQEFWEPKSRREPRETGEALILRDEEFSKGLSKVSEGLASELGQSVANLDQEFNSSELFLSDESRYTFSSTGWEQRKQKSRIYGEVCFSDQKDGVSEEFLETRWAGTSGKIELRDLCSYSAVNAQNSLACVRPPVGSQNVLISRDVVAQLLEQVKTQLHGEQEYLKLPHLKIGEEWLPRFQGMSFELSLDPKVNYALASQSHSIWGESWESLPLLSSGQVVNQIMSERMSQYLKKTETAEQGVMDLKVKGAQPVDQLRSQEGGVLEVIQFSGLFCDPMTLTFSSEIRLAKWYKGPGQEPVFVKGGNLSGNIRENFSKILFSEEQGSWDNFEYGTSLTSYRGPAYALLNDVEISV